jgi:membrane fusion protein (multidrug efflux system)
VKRTYQEGAAVRKGDVLFEIDRRPFENAVSQAAAHLAEGRAQLAKADRDIARDRPLAEQRAIAQSQLDNDLSAHDAAEAAVASAQAALDTAQLNLGFTHVTSLIDGVAAIATAQIGDLVGPTTLLTTVSQLDPIKVYFPLSEQEYLGIARELGQSGSPSRLWQASGGLVLVLADGTTHPTRGTVLAVDREVDPKMGTIRISALFPNPGNVLRPGQGARIRAQTSVRTDALLVPQRAVSELQNGYLIRVLTPDNHVNTRHVTLGRRVGSRWIVESGLKPGDQVIVEGAAVKDGSTVSPHPYVVPAAAE